jgi:hypothetical protein
VALVVKLHSPGIVKYFGGNNMVTGRAALEAQLKNWFQHSRVEFVENKVESTVFIGNTAGINPAPFEIQYPMKDRIVRG